MKSNGPHPKAKVHRRLVPAVGLPRDRRPRPRGAAGRDAGLARGHSSFTLDPIIHIRGRARRAFLDDRAVVTVAHAPADAAEAPTRLLLRRRDGSHHNVAGPGGALAVITTNGTWVAAADVFGSVALYDAELNRRWLCPALFHGAQAHVALTLGSEYVYV